MRTLQSQMEWGRRAQWVTGAIMVIMLVGFYFFLYRPQTGHLNGLRMQIDAKQRQLGDQESRARILPDVELEVAKLSGRVDKFDQKLPKSGEVGTFLRDINTLSQRFSLRRWNVKPRTEHVTRGLYSEAMFDLSFEGDFANVMSFIRQTEQMPRLTRVRSINYRSADPESGVLQVDMSIQIFFTQG